MKKVLYLFLTFAVTFQVLAQDARDTARTSIAMLNYLATQTKLIEKSNNNRLILDDIRRNIQNNTNPAIVDETTQKRFNELLTALTGMGVTALQREKLQIQYENEKAQVLSKAMPNPLYLLAMGSLAGRAGAQTAGSSYTTGTSIPYVDWFFRPISTATTTIASAASTIRNMTNPFPIIGIGALMTVDSFLRYKAAQGDANMHYLFGDLDLQADDLKNLSSLTDGYYSYTIDISRKYNLDASHSLNLDSIGTFVDYILDDGNIHRRLQWLTSNQDLYAHYGPYWLGLTGTYYDLGMYQECLAAIRQYENIQAPIFRKDYDFAMVLPKVIIAASNVYGNNAAYRNAAEQYLQKIIDNTEKSDWSLRYFAAQGYIGLAVFNREAYLPAAYKLLVDSVTYLSREQEERIKQYIAPITVESKLTGEAKKQAEKDANELKKQRKTELPPLHPALALVYQTLFPLMDELNKTQAQRIEVSNILNSTFVMPEFRHTYFGDAYNYSSRLFAVTRALTGVGSAVNSITSIVSRSLEWGKITLKLPAAFLSQDSTIDVNVIGTDTSFMRTDVEYTINGVVRKGNDISEFIAELNIPLGSTLIINNDQEYKLVFTIKTHDMVCNVNFVSPVGKNDFSFVDIE